MAGRIHDAAVGAIALPGYRIVRPVASGGMGSVYEAEKESSRERFAVKFMLSHLGEDPTYRARFEREISALRAIRHPNVVDVFEWHLPGRGSAGTPYVVMEFLRGEALEDLLRRERCMPWPEAVRMMLQVLDGLAAAHAAGVLHRDLGPSNIFLVPEPGGSAHVKLLDFGLARPLEGGPDAGPGVTQEGTWLGKPAYVAPEIFRNEPLDECADLFACGMILYRMLAGCLPYRETSGKLLWMERYAERSAPPEYPSPRTFDPSIPEPVDEVVARAIRKMPIDRYGSAKHMQHDLLRVAPGTGTEVSPPARPPRKERSGSSVIAGRSTTHAGGPARPALRRPAVVAAVVVGVALLAAVSIIIAGRGGRDEPPAGPLVAAAAGSQSAVTPQPRGAARDPVPHALGGADVRPTPPAPAAERPAAPGALSADAPPPAATPVVTAETGPRTVRISFVGVPDGAEIRVNGRLVRGGNVAEVEKSEVPVRVSVTVPAGGFEPFVQSVVPSEGRTIRVRLRAASAAPAPAASIPGRFDTVFSTDYDDRP